jgi:hypothetical protein
MKYISEVTFSGASEEEIAIVMSDFLILVNGTHEPISHIYTNEANAAVRHFQSDTNPVSAFMLLKKKHPRTRMRLDGSVQGKPKDGYSIGYDDNP